MRIKSTIYRFLLGILIISTAQANDTMLLAGYDVIRDYYKRYIPVFIQDYAEKYQAVPNIAQSYAGASKQATAVQNGLPADVVALNQQNDIETLVKQGLVLPNWQQQYPNQAEPFHTVIVFLVRQGNPKKITDWQDLIRPDVKVVFANPKTSGNGRYVYLSALGFATQQYRQTEQIEQFMQKFLHNVPVFDTGARAASITFSQREIGDVLITAENEAALLAQTTSTQQQFSLVYPTVSANIPVLVAAVSKNSARHQNQQLVDRFITSLWQDKAQRIAAESEFRPNNPRIFAEYKAHFPAVSTFNINQQFGDWQQINQRYFADGAQFDHLYFSNR